MEKNKQRGAQMLVPTIIMAFLTLVLIYIGYRKGDGEYILGLKAGFNLMIEVLPLLFFSFLVAGLIQVVIPETVVSKWIGEEAGIKGILLAVLAGFLIPGGPYLVLPILAGLLYQGLSIGSAMAFYTAKFLCGFSRLPIEIAILGWKFILVRIVITSFFPILAGIMTNILFGRFFK